MKLWPRITTLAAAPFWPLERTKGLPRLFVALAYLAIAIVPIGFLARGASLRGLPDPGEPFDVAAFRASDPPGEDNAVELYNDAIEGLNVTSEQVLAALNATSAARMPRFGAMPPIQNWRKDNREPLELWLKGTERKRLGRARTGAGVGRASWADDGRVTWLVLMANLEAGDLENDGKLVEAWKWRRAVLRFSRHVGQGGDFAERRLGASILEDACAAIDAWSVDDEQAIETLKRALADTLAAAELTAPISDGYKVAYLEVMNRLEHPSAEALEELRVEFIGSGDDFDVHRQSLAYQNLRWFLSHEPERSRRIARAIFKNWLEFCDLPRSLQPPIDPQAPGLYATANDSTTVAQLSKLYAEPGLAKWVLGDYGEFEREASDERQRLARTIMQLARTCFTRERGIAPASDADLVGPYLKRMPAGYAAGD